MIIVTRTEQIWVKTSKNLSGLFHLSKNLYNEGNYIIRQKFFKNGNWIHYNSLYHLIKSSENYQKLPSQSAQQILKILNRNWLSFFRAVKAWRKDKNKFLGRPKLPNYKSKNGEFIIIFTNQQVKLKEKTLKFPRKVRFEVKTRLPESTDIREVRVIPKGVGYILEVVYNKNIKLKFLTKDKVLAIDLGVRNLITAVNNNGLKLFVIKGGVTKSINQYYNKERARIQSTYNLQDIKSGKTMKKLINKRNRKINDYFHKSSREIIDYCVINDIGTLVIGYNQKWKQRCRIGKRNTQNFITIPYFKLVQKIEYKAEEQGITIIKQEESHSSKCSFLENETITHQDHYIGKRICRGLF